jgi:hypothetical protein
MPAAQETQSLSSQKLKQDEGRIGRKLHRPEVARRFDWLDILAPCAGNAAARG